MKRDLLKILIFSLIAVLIMACGGKKEIVAVPDPVWDEASIVLYANIGQLHSKGDITKVDLAKLLDCVADENKEKAEIVASILLNPTDSGITLDKPAYIAVRECDNEYKATDMYAIIELSDATKLDATLKQHSDIVDNSVISVEGDKRIIAIDNTLVVGYNSKRLAIIYKAATSNETVDLNQMIRERLEFCSADMSRFGSRDLALYFDIDQLLLPAEATTPIETSETEENQAEIAKEEDIESPYSDYFDEQASAIVGISFENDTIVLSADCEGVSDLVMSQLKVANSKHLTLLDASPIAILNAGINGEAAADLLDVAINKLTAKGGVISGGNEFNIYKNIALGIIGSINGDLMLALSEADGKLIDDVIDGKRLVFTKAKALFAADVQDDYIMQNVKTFGGGLLNKVDNNTYSLEVFGNKLSIGQREDMFYLGINNSAQAKRKSAADEEWSNNVRGSYLYAMVDFNKLFSTSFGKAALTTIYDNASTRQERERIKEVTRSVDRFHILANGDSNAIHGECTVTLKQTNTNAFNQLLQRLAKQAE